MDKPKSAISNFRLSIQEKQILKATADKHFQGKISTMLRYLVFSGIPLLEEASNLVKTTELGAEYEQRSDFLLDRPNISQMEKPLANLLAGTTG